MLHLVVNLFFCRCYVDFFTKFGCSNHLQKWIRSWRLLESRAHHWHSHTTTFGRLLRPCPMWYLSKKKIKVFKTTRDCADPPFKKKRYIEYVTSMRGMYLYIYILYIHIYMCTHKKTSVSANINKYMYIHMYIFVYS